MYQGLAALVLATSCSQPQPPSCVDESASFASAAASHRDTWPPGQAAIVELGDASFWEGVVERTAGDSVEVRVGEGSQTVDHERVHPLDARAQPPAPGTYAACRVAPRSWAGCLVGGDGATTTDESGDVHRLAPRDVVALGEGAQGRVRARMERMTRARSFDRAATAMRKPARPPGWRPLPGKTVIAWFGEQRWSEARIVGVAPGEVELEWVQRRTRGKRASDRIAPAEAARAAPTPGGWALARPEGGQHWQVYRVLQVREGAVTLEDRYGAATTANVAQVIALSD